MKKCKSCWLAYTEHTYITENNIIEETKRLFKDYISYQEFNNKLISEHYPKYDSPRRLYDKRITNIMVFNHCPYCGTKINWKKYKDMVDEQCTD